jgi:hypothetical protein
MRSISTVFVDSGRIRDDEVANRTLSFAQTSVETGAGRHSQVQ